MPQAEITIEIDQRIDAFKASLQQGADIALTQHVLRHECSIVGADIENAVRACVATEFGTTADHVWIVGSAKLGFSPKPGQYFKHFSDHSDIDVALVSPRLYEEVWREVFQMDRAGEYFDKEKFSHYHLRGWIRPDALPPSAEYNRCRSWWKFFKDLSSKEDFMRMKIRGGLYFDSFFLRQYQLGGLTVMREHLIGGMA
ncbi:MAG: hypothetical protein V4787_24655 [Pseudomonadota bacterium]